MTRRFRSLSLFIAAVVLTVGMARGLANAQGTSASSPPATAPGGAAQSALVPTFPPSGTSSTPAMAGQASTANQTEGTLAPLPESFSPWSMFLHADIVVRVVIIGLLLAALLTWTIWLAKTLELMVAKRRLRRAWQALRDVRSLSVAVERLRGGSGVAQALVREAADEWRRSAAALEDRDGLKERIVLHLERIEAIAGRRMMVGTGLLATIGSTAPFVGLFGTVWGIMNSFIGISKLHTTNLAVVAPGIAEALLATACGLVAAIPAVVIYNHFVRQIGSYKALAANTASAVMALVSRDLSHNDHEIAGLPKAEPVRADVPQPTQDRSAETKPLRMVRE